MQFCRIVLLTISAAALAYPANPVLTPFGSGTFQYNFSGNTSARFGATGFLTPGNYDYSHLPGPVSSGQPSLSLSLSSTGVWTFEWRDINLIDEWVLTPDTAQVPGTGTIIYSLVVENFYDTGVLQSSTVIDGTATLTISPGPVIYSIASGAGGARTFTPSYTYTAGAASLGAVYILFNVAPAAAGSCYAEYNPAANTFRLLNDAGNIWLGPITAGSGSLSNSQCTVNGTGGSGAASGNTLTVAFPVVFTSGFTGPKNIFLYAVPANLPGSGAFADAGTWTVNASAPQPVSLNPSAGSGTSGVFTGVFNHTGGASRHYLEYMLFLPTPNAVNYTAKGSCLMEYNKFINGMRLVNDAGTDWLGGPSGLPIAGGGTLSNSVCTLNVGASSAQFNGSNLTVNYSVTFAPGFTGRLGTFLQELDVDGNWAGVTEFGNWTANPATAPVAGPNATPVTPASGTGSSATFTTTLSHSGGLSAIYFATMLVSPAIVGSPGCQVFYFPGSNTLNLIDDAGTGFVSEGGVAAGSGFNPLYNSKCWLTAGSVTPASGTTANMALTLSFVTSVFGGTKNVYVDVFDTAGLVTQWVSGATWTVQ